MALIRKRIVVLESNQLIHTGVRMLLANRQDADVMDITVGMGDPTRIFENINPDIIIVEEASLLANVSWCVQALRQPRPVRIIVLNTTRNDIQVWDRCIQPVDHVDDFLGLI